MVLLVGLALAAGTVMAQGRRDAGRHEYQSHCASCHGPSGKGDGPVFKYLVQPPTDLTTLAKRNGGVFPSLRVAESIDGRGSTQIGPHGTREMPVWGTVFRAPDGAGRGDAERRARRRMVALLDYLSRIQEK